MPERTTIQKIDDDWFRFLPMARVMKMDDACFLELIPGHEDPEYAWLIHTTSGNRRYSVPKPTVLSGETRDCDQHLERLGVKDFERLGRAMKKIFLKNDIAVNTIDGPCRLL